MKNRTMCNCTHNEEWKEVNMLYREENTETQVLTRIQERLLLSEIDFCEITSLEWNHPENKVKVSLDNIVYGIFNYKENLFEEINN